MTGPTWIYDGSLLPDPHGRGERAVRFLKRLKHPKSTAERHAFQLYPFMDRIIRRVYGDTDAAGQRRVKTVFLLLPRGNRKTTLGAGLAMLHTFGPERITGGYAVSAAVDREQARIAFDEAKMMIEMHRALTEATHIRDTRSLIEHPKSGSIYHAASAEAKSKHGKTPTFVLADELHAWPSNALWQALRTGLSKTPESLLWIITTAGRGQLNLAYDLYAYAKGIEAGEIVDPGFLPILFETPADADWKDEALWFDANPGLEHGFPDIDGLRQLAREAENRPSDREAFRQYHLNIWIDSAAAPWLDMPLYDEGGEVIDLDALVGEPCWIGVDLSSTEDLTAVVAAFLRPNGGYIVLPQFFVPQDTLRRRSERDGVPYVRWAEEGHIIPTPGNVVDYDWVENAIMDLAERYRVMEIAIDRWNSTGTINRLTAAGLPVAKFGQGFASMSPACREVERAILSRKLHHGGHPVLRWCFQNAVIVSNPAGDVKFDKSRAAEKIDGAVATAMAVARAAAAEAMPSVYETEREGFLFV